MPRQQPLDDYDAPYDGRDVKLRTLGLTLGILGGALIVVVALPLAIFAMRSTPSVSIGSRLALPRSMPEIIVGDNLARAGASVGLWRDDLLFFTGTVSLPPDSPTSLTANSITVSCVGPGGVKLPEGFSQHSAIRGGESARVSVYFSGQRADVARIVLDLR
jgi:hypothetical protein